MKLRQIRATKYDTKTEHASYGIYNYMVKHGVSGKDQQLEVINAFINIAKIKGTNTKTKKEIIQERFQDFAKFFKTYKETFFNQIEI